MVSTIDIIKWVAVASILVTTLIGNILPMWVRKLSWTSRLESMAGGVFLGAGLGHLLDDAYDDIPEDYTYPIAPAVCLGSFLILTAVEYFTYGEHDEEFQGDSISQPLMTTADEEEKRILFSNSNKYMTVPIISLFIIMCVHSVIEGIALGFNDKQSGVIAIFIAIIGHKPVEAFALSLIILRGLPTKWLYWVMVGIYVILTPIGIMIGLFSGDIDKLASGIIASFSAGTFLFVGCHEWSEMFEGKGEWKTSEKVWHYGFFLFGVVWMMLIAIIEVYE